MFYIRKRMPDWKIGKNIEGTIIFTGSNICIKKNDLNKSIAIEDVKHLTIKNGRYRIRKYSEIVECSGYFYEFLGNGISEISIQTKDNETFKLKYIIYGEDSYLEFKTILTKWYIQKTSIEESKYYCDKWDKTFLFQEYDKWEMEKAKEAFYLQINNIT